MPGRLHDLRRRARLGLRAELLIVLPLALLLLVVLSTFTLFSYRGALVSLAEERQAEAERLARGVAERQLATGGTPLGAEALRAAAPAARGVGLLDAAGATLAAAGELPPLPLRGAPPAPEQLHAAPFGAGPDGDIPDAVAGFVPLVVPAAGAAAPAPGRTLWARVDLPAATLGAQLRAVRLLSWLVLPVNSALVLLVLLLLRHLLTPYETLLARARQLGPAAAAGEEDEAAFLVTTLERALETLAALGERQDGGAAAAPDGRRADDDMAALERTLTRSLESGLLLLGGDGSLLSLNARGAALLAVPSPAPGTPLAALLAPHPELLAVLESAIAAGQPVQRRECTLERPGQAPATLGLSVHPLRRDDGRTRGYLVLFADLTDVRRRAEESRLSDRLATLGEMAAGAAHEMRNSLATLRGYLTLVERRPDEDSIADFLAEIRREADHLQRVLEDFLAFARPGTARPRLFSMTELVRRAAADPALGGVEVVVREEAGEEDSRGGLPGGGLVVRGDPQLVERALRNVLHNAAQAEREAGRRGPIELTLRQAADGVEVEVADRGAGVPAELRSRLFHPFATGRPGGVGLGLALAHRIVTLHGGTIRLDDRAGGGTLARLHLPRDTFATDGSERSSTKMPANLDNDPSGIAESET